MTDHPPADATFTALLDYLCQEHADTVIYALLDAYVVWVRQTAPKPLTDQENAQLIVDYYDAYHIAPLPEGITRKIAPPSAQPIPCTRQRIVDLVDRILSSMSTLSAADGKLYIGALTSAWIGAYPEDFVRYCSAQAGFPLQFDGYRDATFYLSLWIERYVRTVAG